MQIIAEPGDMASFIKSLLNGVSASTSPLEIPLVPEKALVVSAPQEIQSQKAPSPTPTPTPVPAATVPDTTQTRGYNAFAQFVFNWLKGIDQNTNLPIAGVEVDRMQLLRDLHNSPNSLAVLQYVHSMRGLQHALIDVLGNTAFAAGLANFIVPAASIAFPDLADTYEGKKLQN